MQTVPAPAGVTVGVLLHDDSMGPRPWELVTDLQAMEAGACDAELQVARSSKGVTAVRLACQTEGAHLVRAHQSLKVCRHVQDPSFRRIALCSRGGGALTGPSCRVADA